MLVERHYLKGREKKAGEWNILGFGDKPQLSLTLSLKTPVCVNTHRTYPWKKKLVQANILSALDKLGSKAQDFTPLSLFLPLFPRVMSNR